MKISTFVLPNGRQEEAKRLQHSAIAAALQRAISPRMRAEAATMHSELLETHAPSTASFGSRALKRLTGGLCGVAAYADWQCLLPNYNPANSLPTVLQFDVHSAIGKQGKVTVSKSLLRTPEEMIESAMIVPSGSYLAWLEVLDEEQEDFAL